MVCHVSLEHRRLRVLWEERINNRVCIGSLMPFMCDFGVGHFGSSGLVASGSCEPFCSTKVRGFRKS